MSIMRMVVTTGLGALLVPPCLAQDGGPSPTTAAPDMMKRYEARTRLFRPCPRAANGELVICGRKNDGSDRHRLPLRAERAPGGPLRGETPRASAARVKQGTCGIVQGDPPNCNQGLVVVKASF